MAAELRTEASQTPKLTYVRSHDQNRQEVTELLGTQSSGRSLEEESSSPVWRSVGASRMAQGPELDTVKTQMCCLKWGLSQHIIHPR